MEPLSDMASCVQAVLGVQVVRRQEKNLLAVAAPSVWTRRAASWKPGVLSSSRQYATDSLTVFFGNSFCWRNRPFQNRQCCVLLFNCVDQVFQIKWQSMLFLTTLQNRNYSQQPQFISSLIPQDDGNFPPEILLHVHLTSSKHLLICHITKIFYWIFTPGDWGGHWCSPNSPLRPWDQFETFALWHGALSCRK